MKKKTTVTAKKTAVKVVAKEYLQTLTDLKKQIQEAQTKAAFAVNRELISLYWSIGKTIAERQSESGWGSKIIEKLAEDVQNEFSGIAGFSRTNIFRMRAFYAAYEIVPVPPVQLENLPVFGVPWGHNVVLLIKLKTDQERLWYAKKALENGWSRSMLETWIKSNLYKRQGKAIVDYYISMRNLLGFLIPHEVAAQIWEYE